MGERAGGGELTVRPDPGDLLALRYTISAFRLQSRPHYDVAPDPGFHRWRRGAGPDRDALTGWLRTLQVDLDAGVRATRLKILSAELTEYEQYACERLFSYAVGAGEQVLVVDLAAVPLPAGVELFDFWLLDDERAVRLHYDGGGRLRSAGPFSARHCRSLRDTLLPCAEPFERWWLRNTGMRVDQVDEAPRGLRPLKWRAAA